MHRLLTGIPGRRTRTRGHLGPRLLLLGILGVSAGLPLPLVSAAAQPAAAGRLAGSVEDLDGEPVADARITLEPRPAGSSPPRTTTTDGRGRFSLAGLAPGRWDLRVEAPGLLPAAGWVDVRGGPGGAPVEIWLRSLDEVSPTALEVVQEVPRWLERGNSLLDAGRPAEARAEYGKALPFVAPAERPEVLRAVARTFFLEQDVEATVATLERALLYDRGDADTRALYSALLDQLGRAEEAARHLAELDAGPPPEPPREPGEAEPPPPPPPPPEREVLPPEAHRTGAYRIRFETGGPLADPATVRERYGPMLERLAEGSGRASDAAAAGDLAGETFEVFVPESYRPGTPHGLLVWVSPTPWGGTGIASEGHDEVFAEHGVIRIAANDSGNRRPRLDRVRLALAAARNAMRLYEIDPERVYVGGYSGGGKIAGAAATLFPEVFRGSLHLYGVSYSEPVGVPWEPGSVWRAAYPPPPRERREAVLGESRRVLVTGERDFNRGQTRAVARRMEEDGFERVTLLTVPGASHYTPLPPEWLERALEALDPGRGPGEGGAGR